MHIFEKLPQIFMAYPRNKILFRPSKNRTTQNIWRNQSNEKLVMHYCIPLIFYGILKGIKIHKTNRNIWQKEEPS